ncbi:hypothetical protein [Longivirga aurantiaca]|uniref:Uncharacterized protein n=1 Tax=Longivirga aurantiaca TaxID=1837743 RepID=A0ABW1T177_9ACTN
MKTTYVGAALLTAPFMAVVATGIAVGAATAVAADALVLARRIKH